jgi:hypothetical protein
MPRVSTNSPKNAVTPVFQTAAEGARYVVANDDSYVSIQADVDDPAANPATALPRTPTIALPADATIVLPGPSTNPSNLPSGGDYYYVSDPLGRVGVGGKSITVDGGGYPIEGALTFVNGDPYLVLVFTFDDFAQAWILSLD